MAVAEDYHDYSGNPRLTKPHSSQNVTQENTEQENRFYQNAIDIVGLGY